MDSGRAASTAPMAPRLFESPQGTLSSEGEGRLSERPVRTHPSRSRDAQVQYSIQAGPIAARGATLVARRWSWLCYTGRRRVAEHVASGRAGTQAVRAHGTREGLDGNGSDDEQGYSRFHGRHSPNVYNNVTRRRRPSQAKSLSGSDRSVRMQN